MEDVGGVVRAEGVSGAAVGTRPFRPKLVPKREIVTSGSVKRHDDMGDDMRGGAPSATTPSTRTQPAQIAHTPHNHTSHAQSWAIHISVTMQCHNTHSQSATPHHLTTHQRTFSARAQPHTAHGTRHTAHATHSPAHSRSPRLGHHPITASRP